MTAIVLDKVGEHTVVYTSTGKFNILGTLYCEIELHYFLNPRL